MDPPESALNMSHITACAVPAPRPRRPAKGPPLPRKGSSRGLVETAGSRLLRYVSFKGRLAAIAKIAMGLLTSFYRISRLQRICPMLLKNRFSLSN